LKRDRKEEEKEKEKEETSGTVKQRDGGRWREITEDVF